MLTRWTSQLSPELLRVAPFYLLLALIPTALWMELDALSPWVSLLWVTVLFALSFLRKTLLHGEVHPEREPWRFRLQTPTLSSLVIGLIIALPTALYLAFTFFQEFPFSGDHLHHLFASQAGLQFWRRNLPLVFILFLALRLGARRSRTLNDWLPLVLLLLFFAWSFLGKGRQDYFARYPAGGYFLNFWAYQVEAFFQTDFPLNASRLTNGVTILLWLFLLRPFFLGRFPSLALLPFSVFFFFQSDVIYSFTSSYLEPASLILLLLALEAAVSPPFEGYPKWMPVLLAGAATWFKEPALFAIPFIVFISYGLDRKKRLEAFLAGMISIFPFWTYLQFRKQIGIFRGSQVASLSEALTPFRVEEWFFRLHAQWGTSGVLLLGIVILYGVSLLLTRAYRRVVLGTLGGALFLCLFYFFDEQSLPWTGYPRFELQAVLGVGVLLLVLGKHLSKRPRVLLAVSCAMLLLQLPQTVSFFALTFKPDSARSFSEHWDAPQFFPVRTLVQKAKARGGTFTSLRVISPLNRYGKHPFEWGYPALARSFQMRSFSELGACECKTPGDAVLLTDLYPSGLYSRGNLPLVAWKQDLCAESIRRSCTQTLEERHPENGVRLGVIGF